MWIYSDQSEMYIYVPWKKRLSPKKKTHILHFVPEKRRFLLKYHFPVSVLFDADSKKVGLDFCKVVKLWKFRILPPFGRWWEFCDRHDKSVSATLHSSLRPIFWYTICPRSPYIHYMHFLYYVLKMGTCKSFLNTYVITYVIGASCEKFWVIYSWLLYIFI